MKWPVILINLYYLSCPSPLILSFQYRRELQLNLSILPVGWKSQILSLNLSAHSAPPSCIPVPSSWPIHNLHSQPEVFSPSWLPWPFWLQKVCSIYEHAIQLSCVSSQIAIYYSSGNLVSQVVSKLHYSLKSLLPYQLPLFIFYLFFFALSISQRKIKDIHWKIPHISPSLLTVPLQVFSSRWMKSRGQTSTVSGFLQLFTEH